jgi:hypothetical protein
MRQHDPKNASESDQPMVKASTPQEQEGDGAKGAAGVVQVATADDDDLGDLDDSASLLQRVASLEGELNAAKEAEATKAAAKAAATKAAKEAKAAAQEAKAAAKEPKEPKEPKKPKEPNAADENNGQGPKRKRSKKSGPEELSDYELERQKTMKKNAEWLTLLENVGDQDCRVADLHTEVNLLLPDHGNR